MEWGWLSGKEIIKQVNQKRILIDPFDPLMINPNSYKYHLGNKLLRLTAEILDLKEKDEYEEIIIPEEGLILYPGECYLASTLERFGSNVYASLVTGRSSVGRKFLTNHMNSALISQGFFGNITLEISVIKPTRIYPYFEFGQIFWFTVCGDPCLYEGKYQNQSAPTISMIYAENN